MKNDITTLNEFEAAALLKQWGIPVIDGILANDYPEATSTTDLLGFPVVRKIGSEVIPHKTRRGRSGAEYQGSILSGHGRPGDEKQICRYPPCIPVQKMVRAGTELILGGSRNTEEMTLLKESLMGYSFGTGCHILPKVGQEPGKM